MSHQLWEDEAVSGLARGCDPPGQPSAGARCIRGLPHPLGAQIERPETPAGRYLLAAYGPVPATLPGGPAHESVNHPPGRFLTLAAMDRRKCPRHRRKCPGAPRTTVRLFDVLRDYTLTERPESAAPLTP